MKFLVPRVSLIKLLKACGAPHPLLRIEASGGFVTLSCGNIDAGCEAIVESAGLEKKLKMSGAHRQGRDGRKCAHEMLFSLFCGMGQ